MSLFLSFLVKVVHYNVFCLAIDSLTGNTKVWNFCKDVIFYKMIMSYPNKAYNNVIATLILNSFILGSWITFSRKVSYWKITDLRKELMDCHAKIENLSEEHPWFDCNPAFSEQSLVDDDYMFIFTLDYLMQRF